MQIKVHRTIGTAVSQKQGELLRACRGVAEAVRDPTNSTTFLVRNVLSALDPTGMTIPAPAANQIHCLALANRGRIVADDLRRGKGFARADTHLERMLMEGALPAEAKAAAEYAEPAVFVGRRPFGEGLRATEILEQSLLDQTFRLLTSEEGVPLHPRVPATVATQTRLSVQEAFASWRGW